MIFRACRLALLAWCLGLALTVPGRGDDEPFSEKPAGLVADQALLLLPESGVALSRDLLAGQRERGITVYVLTVSSLRVAVARRKQRLSELGHRYAERSAGGQVGMVLIFEDESGEAAVVASRETDRRFPPFSRNMALGEPLARIQRGRGLARDKVEASARAMLAGLSQIKEQADAAARRDRMVNRAMVVVALLGIGLVLARLGRK